MTDLLGQMWFPVVLVFLATALITLGLTVRRRTLEPPESDEEQSPDPGDAASS